MASYFYAAGAEAYPESFNAVAYALALGFRAIAVPGTSPELLADATVNFRRVHVYQGPADWTPDRWRATWDRLLALSGPNVGVIADPETADQWETVGELEALSFIDTLTAAALGGTRVTLTTFPAHPWLPRWVARLRETGSPVVMSPQIFTYRGLEHAGGVFDAAEVPGGMRPTIAWGSAPRWERTPSEYRAFVRELKRRRCFARGSAWALWHPHGIGGAPALDSGYVAAIRDVLGIGAS